MGITRLKRLITEELSRAFTTREFKKFCWEIEPDLDLYKLTGYPEGIYLPVKEAAKQAVDYFHRTNRTIPLLDLIIHSAKVGFKGEKVVFNNIRAIIKEMNECGFEYNTNLNKVVIIDRIGNRNDWGFLFEGETYNFCFASIDICGNSKLVRKYDTSLIQNTYTNFKTLVLNIAKKRDGRIWSWEGDGGLLVFHLDDYINQTILTSIEILSNLPVFNATSNYLDENIIIRIGINAGEAEYKKNISMINSDAIEITRNIEKMHTIPMTLSVTDRTFKNINALTREYFTYTDINGRRVYQLKFPLVGALC